MDFLTKCLLDVEENDVGMIDEARPDRALGRRLTARRFEYVI